jgi:hypothetical protein
MSYGTVGVNPPRRPGRGTLSARNIEDVTRISCAFGLTGYYYLPALVLDVRERFDFTLRFDFPLAFGCTRSGNLAFPAARFHSSKVSGEISPLTNNSANFRRCALLLIGMKNLPTER